MKKTMIVAGFGPGISSALAERFGQAGFQLALVGRSAERLAAGVKELEGKGYRAQAFPTNLSDQAQAQALPSRVRAALGPIDALAWTAYSNAAGDLLKAEIGDFRQAVGLATDSLLAVVRGALPDLKERKGAVLVANGGLALYDEKVDAMAAQSGSMGLAVANAAKHKLVGLLSQRLRREEVYVGEVMVLGLIKGTAFDSGMATIEPSTVAAKFWELYSSRSAHFAQIG